jgi:hypothetical protein
MLRLRLKIFFNLLVYFIDQSKVEINCKKKVFNKIKPWMNDFICFKIRKRDHIFHLIKRHPNNEKLKNYYKKYRNSLHENIKKLKNDYYKNKFEKCNGSSKETWKLLNDLTGQSKKKDQVFKLKINNVMTEDSLAVANEFNTYFLEIVNNLEIDNANSVSNLHSLEYKNIFSEKIQAKTIFIDPVLPADLITVVKTLKNNTAPGIDGISALLIKEILPEIMNVLLFAINLSFTTGVFPEKLKHAIVVPIFKSGLKSECCNYRPISLLSCFSKVYEKIMKNKLLSFLEGTHFFSKKQFGFRTSMNTENALLNFMLGVYDGLNEGKKVSGLFLDIKKAFDTVDHTLLLSKLFNIGIRGVAHEWFNSYLIGRKQCVKINSVFGEMGTIKSGVPQGSVLGATLFIIFINDLCEGKFFGNLTSFADDTALCYSEDNWQIVQQAMNKDLEALKWWFTVNRLVLSAEKTKYINFTLKNSFNFVDNIKYKCTLCLSRHTTCNLKCATVNQTKIIKYLGLQVDEELGWKFHLNKLKDKINMALRYFYFLRELSNSQVLRMLYFALIQSRLEYGIVFWGNTYESYTKPIYLQQKHALRLILYKRKCEPSRPLFIDQKIFSLKYLYVYKVLNLFCIVHGNIPRNVNEYKNKLRNPNQFLVSKPNNTFFTKTFSFIAPKFYAKLPINLKVLINNKQLFLSKVKKWLFQLENIDDLFQILH